MPLQDMPQTFSYMHAWQMANPHRQVQLNGVKAWQHVQGVSFLRRNRDLLAGRRFTESGMFNLDTFVHDHINTCICQYIRRFLTDNAQACLPFFPYMVYKTKGPRGRGFEGPRVADG